MKGILLVAFAVMGLFVIVGNPTAATAGAVTTIDWSTSSFPVVLGSYDRAIFEWSGVDGDLNDEIDETELHEWVLKIVDTSTSSIIFTDTIVEDGIVQPIGGVARSISDINFHFYLLPNILDSWDNDIPLLQKTAVGITYNFYGGGLPSPFVDISQWINGDFVDSAFAFGPEVTQSTDHLIPEPATFIIFVLGLAGLGFMRRRVL